MTSKPLNIREQLHSLLHFAVMSADYIQCSHGLFIQVEYGDAAVCKVQNMQTKKTVCTWREKYDTAYNQTTNTCLYKSLLSANRQHKQL